MIDPIEIRTIIYNALSDDWDNHDVWLGNVDEGHEEYDLANLVIDGTINLTALATAVADYLNKVLKP